MRKNKNALKFIDMIDRTGLAGERVGVNDEEGYLTIVDVWSENDGVVLAYECNILYKEEYYYALIYYVDRDQYAIEGRCLSYDSEIETVEYGNCSDRAGYYTESDNFNLSGKLVELTWEELKELKVKPPSNNGSPVSEENYYQPFKNE